MNKQLKKIEDGNQQMLAEMEADIEEKVGQMFEDGVLVKKKRTLH